jgi:hypothetical protein
VNLQSNYRADNSPLGVGGITKAHGGVPIARDKSARAGFRQFRILICFSNTYLKYDQDIPDSIDNLFCVAPLLFPGYTGSLH